jgi:hypothetical protein
MKKNRDKGRQRKSERTVQGVRLFSQESPTCRIHVSVVSVECQRVATKRCEAAEWTGYSRQGGSGLARYIRTGFSACGVGFRIVGPSVAGYSSATLIGCGQRSL